MESEIARQALELFDECTKILNGGFRDNEIFWLVYQRYKTIKAKLEELGFVVKEERHLNKKRETLLQGELEIQEISYTLKLVPNFAKDGSHISIGHPTSRIYTGILPLPEENQPTTDVSGEDLKWLQEIFLRLPDQLEAPPEIKTTDQEKWHFTEDQRHALLFAIKRHWNQLEINAREIEIFIGRRETWERTIEQANEVWPSQDGSDRYILCFLIECELKNLKFAREIVKKQGGRILEVCAEPNCSLTQHIQALEGWLDQNLAKKERR